MNKTIHEYESFRAEGRQVIYTPPSYIDENGVITHSLCPVICETTEYLTDPEDVAKQIAEALNFHSLSKRETDDQQN